MGGAVTETESPLAAVDDAALDAAIEARFAAPATTVRRVVVDLLGARLLTEALVAEVPESEIEAAWRAEVTKVSVDLVRVPRVPDSREITRAVASRGADIATRYEEERRLFHKPEKAIVDVVLVAADEVGSGGNEEEAAATAAAWVRAAALRRRVLDGAAFAEIARAESDDPSGKHGGRIGAVTRARMPEAFELPPNAVSEVRDHPRGAMFFRVERIVPAVHRTLDDSRVQREVAALILRDEDELPHARGVAKRVRALLAEAPNGAELRHLDETERLRRETTEPFGPSRPGHVPGVGASTALFDAIMMLHRPGEVTPVILVRQSYVVARLVERTDPDADAWPVARKTYSRRWRSRFRRDAIDRWLTPRLKGEKLWIDMPRLMALSIDELGALPISPRQ